MKKLVNHALVALTILPLMSSCGKSSSSGGGQGPQQEVDEGSIDGSTIDGMYQAKFITLNPQVNGTIPGSLTLYRDRDRLLTYLRLFAGKPKAWHQQGIYMGTKCPSMSDDTNGDGFIDIDEAMRVTGKMIIPLDANMNSQAAGKNFYPLADLSGYYHYEREASFDRMFDDLRTEDRDLTDNVTKLGAQEPFGFAGRVVMVQGVDELTLLPETVATQARRRSFQTLPVTCGIIQRQEGVPGTPDNGEIPGPIGEVSEGQDHPAPAPDNNTTGNAQGGGTVSGTTGTNDNEDGQVGTAGGTEEGSTTGGTTGEEPRRGGFIGGFIGGSSGGSGTTGGTDGSTTGGTAGGSTTGGTDGSSTTGGTTGEQPRRGGFIGGFIGGSQAQ